jgi:tagaturonate reductase
MEKLSKQLRPKNNAPVKVLQFGEGNFMRGFVDWQIQQLNKQGLFQGNVAVVQPLENGLSKMLNDQDNLYTVILQGLLNGEIIDHSEVINVVDQVINPYSDWQEFLNLAESDDLSFVFSNTTEAGISYLPSDKLTDAPQQSFPGKLTAFLYKRFQAGKPGLTIIPCELIDRNGERLKEIIQKLAEQWSLEPAFTEWLNNENIFCCSLVDRIVPGYPRDEANALNERHGYIDKLMVKTEPFMLWVIEGPESLKETLPLQKAGLNVVITDDMTPYRERKVHLLNGPHTAMVPLGLLGGLETVEDVMKDPDFYAYVDQLFQAELIPMLSLPKEDLEEYAEQIKERFLNPYAFHQLKAISLNSISKFQTRLLPIFQRYTERENQLPLLMTASLSALILMYRGDKIQPQDDPKISAAIETAWQKPETAVHEILKNKDIWGVDLTTIPELESTVSTMISQLETDGVRTLILQLKGSTIYA